MRALDNPRASAMHDHAARAAHSAHAAHAAYGAHVYPASAQDGRTSVAA